MKRLIFNVLALVLVSCGEPAMTLFAAVDPRGWEPGDSVTVIWRNSDTVTLYELSLAVDFEATPDPATFGVTITTVTPDTLTVSETVVLRPDLAALRQGEYRTLYRHDVRLMRVGEYRFTFTPEIPVSGLRAAGLVFE